MGTGEDWFTHNRGGGGAIQFSKKYPRSLLAISKFYHLKALGIILLFEMNNKSMISDNPLSDWHRKLTMVLWKKKVEKVAKVATKLSKV